MERAPPIGCEPWELAPDTPPPTPPGVRVFLGPMSYPVTFPRHHRHVMLPTFMRKKTIFQKPGPPPSGHVQRVVLARITDNLRPFWFKVDTIEGTAGDEVLVRFGDVVVQVPAEMLLPVEE